MIQEDQGDLCCEDVTAEFRLAIAQLFGAERTNEPLLRLFV